MDTKAIVQIAIQFLAVLAELIELGVKYGPDIIANFQRATNAIMKLFTGEALTDSEKIDIRTALDTATQKRREAFAQAEKEEAEQAAVDSATSTS